MKIDNYTKVMEVPNGLLFMRSHLASVAMSDTAFAATCMVHVPCTKLQAVEFIRHLPKYGEE